MFICHVFYYIRMYVPLSSEYSLLALILYAVRVGKFGGVINLAVWRFSGKSAKLKSPPIFYSRRMVSILYARS